MQLETPNDIALDMADAELAHATLLTTEGATCVAVRNDEVAITRERGVKPLLQWISEGRSFEGWSVADKVVGKAPALLYVQLKPAVVYTIAMSGTAASEQEPFDVHLQGSYHRRCRSGRRQSGLQRPPCMMAEIRRRRPVPRKTAHNRRLSR